MEENPQTRYLIRSFLKEILLPQEPVPSNSESQDQALNEETILEIKDTEELITEESTSVTVETSAQPELIMEESINDQVKEETALEIREGEDLMEKEVIKEDSAEPTVIDEVISEGVVQPERPAIFQKWSGLMERIAKTRNEIN